MFEAGLGQAKPSVEVDVTKCWSYRTGDSAAAVVATDGGRVFVGTSGARVAALSLDGKKLWSTELGGDISSNILAVESGLFLATSAISETATAGGGQLRSISKETGVTSWTLKLPEANKHFINSFNGSVIVVSDSGEIQSVEARSGAVTWKRDLSKGFAAEPVFRDGAVTVAATGGQIFSVSMASGEIDSMLKVPFNLTALGRTAAGSIVVGDDRGNVSMLANGSDKPYWKFKSGGEISSIFAIDDNILTASHDNFVYLLGGRNGGLGWKRRLAGRIAQIGGVWGKFVLISSFEEHGAILADLANGKVVGQIALGEKESIVYKPISSNGMIFVATNEAVYSYSLSRCQQNEKGGSGK